MAGSADRFVDREEIAFLLGVDLRTISRFVRQHSDFPSRVQGRARTFPVRRCLQWQQDRIVANVVSQAAPSAPDSSEEAARRKLLAEAQLAEVKLAKARAEVISVSLALKEIHDVFARVRATLLGKPGEYAPQILHLEDMGDATRVLRRLVDNTLGELQVRFASDVVEDADDEDREGPPAPDAENTDAP